MPAMMQTVLQGTTVSTAASALMSLKRYWAIVQMEGKTWE